MTPEQHADAILRAAGSSLAYYTMPGTRADILAAVQAVRDEGVQQWQDISTAPKDGSAFLGFWPTVYLPRLSPYQDGDGQSCPLVTYWETRTDEGYWATADADSYDRGPTHWQPLPKAPQP